MPGHGKPLDLRENPYEDPTMRIAHRILKDNGFSLPWIEEGKQIDLDIDKMLKKLSRSWNWYRSQKDQSDGTILKIWDQAKAEFFEEVTKINKRIKNFNIQIPLSRFEKQLIDENKILQELTGTN